MASLSETIRELFYMNEEAHTKGACPLSDDDIVAVLHSLFPNHKTVYAIINKKKHRRSITAIRGDYNEGRFGETRCVSFRYDAKGRRCASNNIKKHLTDEEQREYLYQQMRKRFPLTVSPSHPYKNAHLETYTTAGLAPDLAKLRRLHAFMQKEGIISG